MRGRVVVAVAALAVASACARPAKGWTEVRFESGARRVVVRAQVADTDAERARGLMARAKVPAGTGMLFVWSDVETRGFWMKDTLVPLDLVSIRSGRVVAVQHMVPCRATPCPITNTPAIDAALEIAAGEAERTGIRPGALVDAPELR